MATVYRARQAAMGRDVAIKVIKPDLAEMGDFVARFEREAHTVASLSHPHILKVFDYGNQGDLVYLVMELLKGGSLADPIRRGPLPLDQASRILDQVASALDYAHRRGIIHRDLKPQNILLDDEGNALLTDFGVAKILSETSGLTQSGVAMGTPSYMSPEQWHGQALDARADIYALGIMAFEMLTGTLPFVADTPPTLMYKHLQEPPPSILERRTDVPPGIQGVIQKALAKNRDQRFSSASELARAFKAALAGQMPVVEDQTNPQPLNVGLPAPESVHQPMPRGTTTERLAPRSRSGVWAIGIVIGLLAVVGISAALLSGRTTPTATALPSATTQSPAPSQGVANQGTQAVSPSATSQVAATPVALLPTLTSTTRAATATASLTPTVPTRTPTQTPSVTPTVDFAAAAQTFDALSTLAVKATSLALTQTQSAGQTATATRWTLTPTATYTPTPNITASFQAFLTERAVTRAAQEALNQTATATLWTPTSTFTLSPTLTPSHTPTPTAAPISAVAANKEWTPQTRTFDGVAMVLVPPGCFQMGGNDGSDDEKPVNEQCFDMPFWIDQTEVTQAQFTQFGGQAANASSFKGNTRPVEQITWFEARDFCAKRGARLPTEAEWEYAARGPDNLVYPWGNTFDGKKVVYDGGGTAEVGSIPAGVSWVGAQDLSGNVWEWVSSLYKPYPYNKDDGRESQDDAKSTRVLRGGSWFDAITGYLRSAYRNFVSPSYVGSDYGFRCARAN